jgi:hypothetical protein
MFNDDNLNGESSNVIDTNLKNLNLAYKKMLPHYNISSVDVNKGAYHSFLTGSLLNIVCDTRSFLSKSSGNILGNDQIKFIKNEITNAYNNKNITAIILNFPQTWNYVKDRYSMDMIKQDFISIDESMEKDKKSIGDHVKSFNFKNDTLDNYKPFMVVTGDRSLAFDDGRNNNFGGFPIVSCGTIDSWLQCRGGPYSHGSFHHSSNSQFCSFEITNKLNDSGKGIKSCIKVRGILAGEDKDPDQDVFTWDTCDTVKYSKRIIDIKCPILWTEKILNGAITLAATILVYLIFFVWIKNNAEKNLSYQYINKDKHD